MGTHILGRSFDENVVVVGGTRFWAERGRIHHEGINVDSYGSISVRDFMQHISGISDMLGNKGGNRAKRDLVRDVVLREGWQNVVDAAVKIARRAREQGMPEDPQACRDLKNRRPKTICVGGGHTAM